MNLFIVVRREEDRCSAYGDETGPPVFEPRYRDFSSLPFGEESIPEHQRDLFKKLAVGLNNVLGQRDSYRDVKYEVKDIYETLCRMYTHQNRIIRQAGPYGAPTDTGFGVYPTAQFIQRSSLPNCEFFFDYNSRLVVRSIRDINEGEGISISAFPKLLEEVDASIGDMLLKLYFTPAKSVVPDGEEDPNEKLFVYKR